jgi:RNA polymerase sigma-70 factor (ECF subfamily)
LEQEIQPGGELPLDSKAFIEVVKKIENGDQAALLALYDGTSPLLFGLVSKILGDKALSEDILVEIFASIWEKSAKYDSNLLPLEWLINLARSKAVARVNWNKKTSKKRKLEIENSSATTTIAPRQQELARSAIGSLVPAQREILAWSYYSGLSCGEIAAQIGKPIGAVKTHARLGLSKLEELFRPLFASEMEKPDESGGDIESRKDN